MWSLQLCYLIISWHQPGVTSAGGYLSVSLSLWLIIDHRLIARIWTNTWKPTPSLLVTETSEFTVNCTQPPGTHTKDSKDFIAVMNLHDNKDFYFPGDQCDRHCSHTTLGNNLVPKSLLLTGYQPQEGTAGRAARARCCNSETQSSSFWPPNEDTNPPGQQSSLMDISFSVFAVLALTKRARSQQILSKPSKLQLQFHYRMASISRDQRAGSKPLP